MADTPQNLGGKPIDIPAPFLAEHGRVSLENSELRRALGDSQRTIEMLVDKVKQLSEKSGDEPETADGLPIIRRRPTVLESETAGATSDAS